MAKSKSDHTAWIVAAWAVGFLAGIALTSGCARQDDLSTQTVQGTALASAFPKGVGAVGTGSGNGEGYGGRIINTYFAVDSSHPCASVSSEIDARSIMIKTAEGFFLTRSDCVDQTPQQVPSDAVTTSPYDQNIATVSGVIFEASGDPTSLSDNYAKVVCRGKDPLLSDSAKTTYVDIIIRSEPNGIQTELPFLPVSDYKQDIVIGAQDNATGQYTVSTEETADVLSVSNGGSMTYETWASTSSSGSSSTVVINGVSYSGSSISISGSNSVSISNSSTSPTPTPTSTSTPTSQSDTLTSLQIFLNQTIDSQSLWPSQSTLPAHQTFAGKFSGNVHGQSITTPIDVTCNSL